MTEQERKEMKEALKEGIKEWMDEKYAALGMWTAASMAALAVAALTWLVLRANGWHKLP